jgi:chaperone modulatory protein CbpM
MPNPDSMASEATIVDEQVLFTLADLCRACNASGAQLIVLVEEGVLEPVGSAPENWRFPGPSLARARAALRLWQDLDLSAAGTALVLDLLDQIEDLRSRLRRAGIR